MTLRRHVRIWLLLLCCALPPGSLAWAGGNVLVVNKSGGSVSLIEPGSWHTLQEIHFGGGPHEVALSPDGRLAAISDYEGEDGRGNRVVLIDVPARTLLRSIDLTPYTRPHGLVWRADGRTLLVTAEDQGVLLVVDSETGVVTDAIATNQELSHMVALDEAHQRAYVSNIVSGSVSVIDLRQGKTTQVIAVGAGAEGITVHPETGTVWVAPRDEDRVVVLDPDSFAVQRTIPVGDLPLRVAFDKAGRHALVSNARDSSLSIITVATGDVREASLAAPQDPQRGKPPNRWLGDATVPIGVLALEDGKTVLVANAYGGYVSVVDLDAGLQVGRFPAGVEPDGLAFSPVGR
jgi:YVTN family beta-propeller protein